MLGLGNGIHHRCGIALAALAADLLLGTYPHCGTLANCEGGTQALADNGNVGTDIHGIALFLDGCLDVGIHLVVVIMGKGERIQLIAGDIVAVALAFYIGCRVGKRLATLKREDNDTTLFLLGKDILLRDSYHLTVLHCHVTGLACNVRCSLGKDTRIREHHDCD